MCSCVDNAHNNIIVFSRSKSLFDLIDLWLYSVID